MKRQSPISVDTLSVIIPYKDLEKLLQVANEVDDIKERVRNADARSAALQRMYTELLEKLREIEKNL